MGAKPVPLYRSQSETTTPQVMEGVTSGSTHLPRPNQSGGQWPSLRLTSHKLRPLQEP